MNGADARAERGPEPAPRDITAFPRALITAALGVVHTVERAVGGEGAVRTARDNAWEAVLADRERAQQRDRMRAAVSTLSRPQPGRVGADRTPRRGQRPVGSSPRSRASHT